MPAGTAVNPAALGVLAGLGLTQASLFPAPRVSILSTGNELVEPGAPLAPGQIRNTNGPMLAAQATRAGGVPDNLGIVRDDRDVTSSTIAKALAASNIVVIAGGVSVGKFDLVPAILEEQGVAIHVRQVRMKPGKPMLFGTKGDALVFGLPGNPVASFVCFELFVRPALRAIAGHANVGPVRASLPLAEDFAVTNDRPTYHPAKLEMGVAGFAVRPLPWLGASDLRGLQPADALMALAPGDTRLAAGQPVSVVVL
jgi:molybdopterin molybdotransferase